MTIDITYRGPGPWGPGIDEDLTETQVDTNFWNLVQAILEKAVQGVSISNFVVVGGQFTVVLSDHTLLGPYPLPIAQIRFRGEWLPETQYLMNEIFTHVGTTYIVLMNHTSEATFDPGANDGLGNDYYDVLLENPALIIPSGGAAGYFLRKVTGTDYDMYWGIVSLSDIDGVEVDTPIAGQVLTYNGSVWTGDTPITALSELTDVALGTLVTDEVLRWDGAAWVNSPDSAGSLTLSDLVDMDIVDPLINDMLQWDYVDSKWKNIPTRTITHSASGTISVDPTEGPVLLWTIGADSTFNAATVKSGQLLAILIKTSGGNRTVTFGTNFSSKGTYVATGTLSAVLFVGEGTNLGAETAKYVEVSRTNQRRGVIAIDPGIGQVKNDLGDVFSVTPNADLFLTLNFDPGPASQEITIVFTTSGTTSYNITFDSPFKTAGTLATGVTSARYFVMKFISNGTNYIEVSRTGALS